MRFLFIFHKLKFCPDIDDVKEMMDHLRDGKLLKDKQIRLRAKNGVIVC